MGDDYIGESDESWNNGIVEDVDGVTPIPETLASPITTPTFPMPEQPQLSLNGEQTDTVGFASALVGDPSAFFNPAMKMGNNTPTLPSFNPGTMLHNAMPEYQMDPSKMRQTAATAETSQASNVDARQTASYDAMTTFDQVRQQQMTGAQGSVSDAAKLQAEQLDMKGVATGTNTDGTRNVTGEALNKVALQNTSKIIDTSTVAGKLLAEQLGEGNYVDSKATVTGQLDVLSKQFVDSATGEPKIPTWAAGVARNVSRIAAFKGMTGSAATAAMSQAIMEATLPIATQEAGFFQTLTVTNLSNRQQQAINTANVLSKMEMSNLDNRMVAAVENSKNFMAMDLANLNNDQQARVINTQSRVQSILEDSRAVNASRLFTAQSENEMGMFYDNLNSQINQFNSAQSNSMSQFNTGQANTMAQFNATMEDSRERFYREMQYNIDTSNAKWRQTVTLTNTQMEFEAAATDVKNLVGLSVEQLNRLWDRSDSLLDYSWKSSENAMDRALKLEAMLMQAEQADEAGKGNLLGTIISGAASIGAAWMKSDSRLKNNVTRIGKTTTGLNLYKWEWNEEAQKMGVSDNPTVGVMAQEAYEFNPDLVSIDDAGYMSVNYEAVFNK